MNYLIRDDGLLVVERWSGEIGHQEALLHERRLLGDESLGRRAVVLSDSRFASFPETNEHNLAELARLHGDPGNHGSIAKSAVCVMAVDTFDKPKLYRDLCLGYGVEIGVFSEIGDACAWLGADVW